MGIPFPNTAPTAWNTVKLGTLTLPGIATVAVKPGQDVEVKKAKGGVGATTTVQGPKAAPVTIKLKLFRQEHLDAWAKALPVLLPAKESGAPLVISHPKTDLYKIASVTVQDIDDPGNEEKGDVIEITISCIQFNPAKKTKATKTSTRLDARNNNLSSDHAARDIAVERPSRDRRNTSPRR